MKTLKLQSASKSNVFFDISIEEVITPYNQRLKCTFLSKHVSIEIVKGVKCVAVSHFNIDAEIKSFAKSNFGADLKKNDIYFKITDESYSEYKAAEFDFEERKKEYKIELQSRIDSLQTKYYMYDLFDWGDYTSDKIRKIIVVREKLEDETHGLKEGIVVKELILNNKRIGQYEGEWEECIKAMGGEVNDSKMHLMGVGQIEKWQKIFTSILIAEAEEREANEKAKREAEAREKARRESCFIDAKKTGKPVLLYSTFLSGDQIPRRFRDDDSDMGHLCTYAMPDGTTQKKFSHSY